MIISYCLKLFIYDNFELELFYLETEDNNFYLLSLDDEHEDPFKYW